MFDNVIVVYKYIGDLMFYVTGSQDENELILYTVLQAFYESVSILLRWGWVWVASASTHNASNKRHTCAAAWGWFPTTLVFAGRPLCLRVEHPKRRVGT